MEHTIRKPAVSFRLAGLSLLRWPARALAGLLVLDAPRTERPAAGGPRRSPGAGERPGNDHGAPPPDRRDRSGPRSSTPPPRPPAPSPQPPASRAASPLRPSQTATSSPSFSAGPPAVATRPSDGRLPPLPPARAVGCPNSSISALCPFTLDQAPADERDTRIGRPPVPGRLGETLERTGAAVGGFRRFRPQWSSGDGTRSSWPRRVSAAHSTADASLRTHSVRTWPIAAATRAQEVLVRSRRTSLGNGGGGILQVGLGLVRDYPAQRRARQHGGLRRPW
jgi:hypothetical protein